MTDKNATTYIDNDELDSLTIDDLQRFKSLLDEEEKKREEVIKLLAFLGVKFSISPYANSPMVFLPKEYEEIIKRLTIKKDNEAIIIPEARDDR